MPLAPIARRREATGCVPAGMATIPTKRKSAKYTPSGLCFALFGVSGPGTENRVHKELPVGTSSSGKFVVSRTGHTYDVEPDVKSEIPQFSNGLLTYF